MASVAHMFLSAQPALLARLLVVARLMAAAALGLCWGAGTAALALLPLLFALWGTAKSRKEAFFTAFLYYLVAIRGIGAAGANFWALGRLEQIFLALSAAFALSLPWGLAWTKNLGESGLDRGLRAGSLLILGALPPAACFGFMHPLVSAGALLPGLGWLGLGLTALLCVELSRGGWAVGAWAALALGGLWGLSFAAPAAHPSGTMASWTGAQTRLAAPANPNDWAAQGPVAIAAMTHIDPAADVTLLPEGVGGTWTPAMQGLWFVPKELARVQGREVLVGALLPAGDSLDSAIVVLGSLGSGPYLQRYPIPVAMWQPWAERGSVRAHWGSTGTIELGAKTAGVLVCFEQLLVLPALQSVAEGAEVLLAPANQRWVRGTNMPASQRAATEAWGRLFHLPVVRADNA